MISTSVKYIFYYNEPGGFLCWGGCKLFAKSGNAVKVILATNYNLKKATIWFLAEKVEATRLILYKLKVNDQSVTPKLGGKWGTLKILVPP